MAGNVWEWVNDWYYSAYYANSPVENPEGPESGEFKVVRRGSFHYSPVGLRGAYRTSGGPVGGGNGLGFRCVLPGR